MGYRQVRCRLGALVIAAAWLGAAGAWAAPRLSGEILRHGASPRMIPGSWVYVQFALENPDDRQVELRVIMRNSQSEAVFEADYTLLPQSRIKVRQPVTVSRANEYTLALFEGDERLMVTSVMGRVDFPAGTARVLTVNDAAETVPLTTDIAKSPFLLEPVLFTYCRARSLPTHGPHYGSSLVVMLRPDYSAMTAQQFAALLDHVHGGGTLVWLEPSGVLAALDTPLADVLPVTPLRLSLTETAPGLDSWGRAHFDALFHEDRHTPERTVLEDVDGMPFLESVPTVDGVTVLRRGEYPIVRWRRVGLGRTCVVTVAPSQELLWASFAAVPLWNHLLSWRTTPFNFGHPTAATELPKLQQALTGYRIPGVRVVAWIVVGYVVFGAVILVIGFRRRRHGFAWVACAATGTALTAGLLFAAYQVNADRPSRSATVVAFARHSGRRSTTLASVSLFSKTEERLAVPHASSAGLIRSLPPAGGYAEARAVRRRPLLIRTSADRVMAPSFRVPALQPRALAVLDSADRAVPIPVPPTLRVSADGVSLAPFPIPGRIRRRATQAGLLFRGGIVPVSVDRGVCRLSRRPGDGLRFDSFLQALGPMLLQRGLNAPALVVLQDAAAAPPVPVDIGAYDQRGYVCHTFPLQVAVTDRAVRLPWALLPIVPGNAMARMAQREGGRYRGLVRSRDAILRFQVLVPGWLPGCRLDTVTADIDITNPGANLRCDVALAPFRKVARIAQTTLEDEDNWGLGVPPTAVTNTHYRFEAGSVGPAEGACLNRFQLMVRLSPKRRVSSADVGAVERANTWAITRLRVSLNGHHRNDPQSQRL